MIHNLRFKNHEDNGGESSKKGHKTNPTYITMIHLSGILLVVAKRRSRLFGVRRFVSCLPVCLAWWHGGMVEGIFHLSS